jgi:GNAT superfamily N-acetyltransferase
MGAVWLRAALKGYDGIFPPEAPKPTAGELIHRWRRVIAGGPPSTTALVACHGTAGAVVGTVEAMSDVDGPYNAHLRRLYVDPGHWGRGIGRRLHDAALDRLRSAGHGLAAPWVIEANERARSMYERWGWRPTSERQARTRAWTRSATSARCDGTGRPPRRAPRPPPRAGCRTDTGPAPAAGTVPASLR